MGNRGELKAYIICIQHGVMNSWPLEIITCYRVENQISTVSSTLITETASGERERETKEWVAAPSDITWRLLWLIAFSCISNKSYCLVVLVPFICTSLWYDRFLYKNSWKGEKWPLSMNIFFHCSNHHYERRLNLKSYHCPI